MRWKLTTSAALLVALGACAPDIPETPPPQVVVARFDPAATPAVVPSPNDLALDPATGRPAVPLPPNATPADEEFVAFLGSLNGFPASSTATATFAGAVDPASATPAAVRVIDLTDGTPVTPTLGLSTAEPDRPMTLSITGPGGGWTSGHRYLVAVLGGEGGLRGASGEEVVASPIWSFVRSANSLVTCADLTAADCRSVTSLIDDNASAVRLEQLRRSYAPLFESLAAQGIPREQVVLLWTFTIASGPSAVFDPASSPPRIPTPTDLAIDPATGLVNAPVDPTATAAEQEFVRDYLNTLDGFPTTVTASASVVGAPLDPASVSPATVVVQDVTDLQAGGTGAVAVTTTYDLSTNRFTISPDTAWQKGHTYAIALVGGEGGLTGQDGVPLGASTTWALARSSSPLVSCQDLTSTSCRTSISVAPITLPQALSLERVRRGLAPVLDALDGAGIPREDVALLWTFRIVSQPEATFDPAGSVIPFPNNLLLEDPTGPAPRVNLPDPGGSPLLSALITGLNTLDGFSLTAPAVSENSPTLGATDLGEIDEATLAAGAGLVALTPGALQPQVNVCVDCTSSLAADGSIPENPPQLQYVPVVPLAEQTTYGAFLSTAAKSTEGKSVVANPVFAFVRSSAPLVDGNGVSQVSALTDAQAQALEPLRQGLAPVIDGLVAAGIARRDLSLAWAYRTQSSFSQLQALQGVPATLQTAGVLSTDVTGAADDALTAAVAGIYGAGNQIGTVFSGTLEIANLLTGPNGTLDPGSPDIQTVPFLLTVPTGTAPAGGWPVVLFGHGLSGSRSSALFIANAFAAAGRATLAIDTNQHGARSDCRGSGGRVPGVATDADACASGACSASTGTCAGGFAPNPGDPTGITPAISGWNIIEPTNLFATRDRFRQQVVDLAQLVQVVRASGPASLSTLAGGLSGEGIAYVGQSLGGILGTLFTAASPDVERAVLNAPGGGLTDILLTAPAFSAQAASFNALLAGAGLPQGTPGYDDFIRITRWVVDPADPLNAGVFLRNAPGVPAQRDVLLQYITQDQVIPNPTTEALIAAANAGEQDLAVSLFDPPLADRPLAARHGFLLVPGTDPTTTTDAQTEAATFITSGQRPAP